MLYSICNILYKILAAMRLSRSAELRGACSLVRICSPWCLLITGLFCSSIHLRWLSGCFLMPSSKSMIIWLRAEKQRLLCPLCEARIFCRKDQAYDPLAQKTRLMITVMACLHLSQSVHRFKSKIGSCISVMMVVTVDFIWRNRE